MISMTNGMNFTTTLLFVVVVKKTELAVLERFARTFARLCRHDASVGRKPSSVRMPSLRRSLLWTDTTNSGIITAAFPLPRSRA